MKFRSLAACLCVWSCAAGAQNAEFDAALREYRAARWSAAYGRLIVLANNGHRDAARMALFMYQFGPTLYNTRWDASVEDVEVWTRTAGAWRKPGDPERITAPLQPVASAKATNTGTRATRFQGRGAHVVMQR